MDKPSLDGRSCSRNECQPKYDSEKLSRQAQCTTLLSNSQSGRVTGHGVTAMSTVIFSSDGEACYKKITDHLSALHYAFVSHLVVGPLAT